MMMMRLIIVLILLYITTINSITVTCTTYGASGCCDLCTSSPCHMTFSDSITTINMGAFSGCILLTSVNIPTTITTIGHSAFA